MEEKSLKRILDNPLEEKLMIPFGSALEAANLVIIVSLGKKVDLIK